MYTRRSLVWGLLATALISAQDASPVVQVRMLTRLEVVQVRK
jgi:hypothetical protein